MAELRAHGLAVQVLPGWEGTIFLRVAGQGETTHPVLHLATFPLPAERGDFGTGAVELMEPDDVFVVVFDYGPASASAPLFAGRRMPRLLSGEDFTPYSLQRALPGQAGAQWFFCEAGRALSLYVVLGSFARRDRLVSGVNAVLRSFGVDTRP
jgi:hypothetical protein